MYEEFLSRFLIKIIKKDDTFIDIGAHIGFFSLIVSYLVGNGGKVFSIEPDDENYKWLNHHIKLNQRENVVSLKLVVSETDGDVEFFTNADNDGGHALWNPGLHHFNKISRDRIDKNIIPSVRFDTLVGKNDIQFCKVVKIDTEGAEYTILKSGESFFNPDKVSFIVCELNEFGLGQLGVTQHELRALMREKGYETFIFPKDDYIPILVPERTLLSSPYVYNVLFTTQEKISQNWPSLLPYQD
jgi:FkbM family methyltransferase